MRSRKPIRPAFLILTCAEPFPVLRSHVNWTPENPGPFYAAGSKTYHEDTPANRQWAENVIAYWAGHGYHYSCEVSQRIS